MPAKVQNGIEIEIIVRQRKDGKPVGQAGHAFVVGSGDTAALKRRKEIAKAVCGFASNYVTGSENGGD